MLETFLNTLKTEWAVLSSAPWPFAITSVVAFSVAFAACRWAYAALLQTAKDRLDGMKERLDAKDDQIQEYRERLHLVPATGSQYSKLTHKELQDHVVGFVAEIRTWYSQADAETRRVAEQQWQAMARATTEEERHRLWDAHTSTHTNGFFRLMSEFEQKFKVNAILLRDEMRTRIPNAERSTQKDRRYELPVNTFGIKEIVDDLERSAKGLC